MAKVVVGTTADHVTVWMDGTAKEVVDRLTSRFKVYATRPTKSKPGKVAEPKKAKAEEPAVA